MSKNKKFNIKSFVAGGTLALLTVGGLAMSATYAASENSQGDGNQAQVQAGPKEGLRDALEANDYQAFQDAIADTPLAETIDTQEEFDKMVEMHTLIKDGDKEGAQAIADELGLKKPEKGERKGGPKVDEEKMAAIVEALENGDFEAWKEAVADTKMGEELLEKVDTDEDFAKMQEVRKLREENKENREQIKAIHDELGLEMKKGPKNPNARQARDGDNGNN